MRSKLTLLFFHICILLKMPLHAQKAEKLLHEGNKFYMEEQFKKAEESYNKALLQQPQRFEAPFNLGDALYSQQKYKEAAQHFKTSAEKAKTKQQSGAAYHNLGNAMLKNNDYDAAIDAYRKALQNNPNDAASQYNLSYALLKKKQQQQQKQKQDQQNNNQDKKEDQQPQQPENKQQNEARQNPNEMSKQQAENILKGLQNKEQNLRKQLYNQGKRNPYSNTQKPW